MQLKYPFLKSAFDLHCLKSRLEKLIRMIIRDIKTQRCLLRSSPCDMPEISSISDRNMKQIMRAAEGLEARLAILNYFLDKDNSLKLRNAILLIN